MATIVVHGTMTLRAAENYAWWWNSWKEGGFLHAMQQGMREATGSDDVWKVGDRPVSEVRSLQPTPFWKALFGGGSGLASYKGHFRWAGSDDFTVREAAGVQLTRYLNQLAEELAPEEPLRIIAHSHGGNVVKLASQNEELRSEIYCERAVFLACPHFEADAGDDRIYHYRLNPDRFGSVLNLYSQDDTVQVDIAQTIAGAPGARIAHFYPPTSFRWDRDPHAVDCYQNSELPTTDKGIAAHGAMHGAAVGFLAGLWLNAGEDFETIKDAYGKQLLPIPAGDDGA